jgi:hypothetical protein
VTFVRSLPRAYQEIEAADGTAITLTIVGDSGGSWSVIREGGRWCLYLGKPPQPRAEVILSENIAWRLFTKGITKEAARYQAIFSGDQVIGEQILEVVSIIA